MLSATAAPALLLPAPAAGRAGAPASGRGCRGVL